MCLYQRPYSLIYVLAGNDSRKDSHQYVTTKKLVGCIIQLKYNILHFKQYGGKPLGDDYMEGKTNVIVIGVVCLIVGILIGVGVGYAAWHNSNDNNSTEETTYWYYIDYNGNQNSAGTATNGWVSAQSDNAFDGLIAALQSNGLTSTTNMLSTEPGTYSFGNYGMPAWINSINGVNPDWATTETSWGSFILTVPANSDSASLYNIWMQTAGLDVSIGNVFYIAITSFVDNSPVLPDTTDAMSGGPFA